MKIEIWSDIMCPFCYLGKRHLELALEQLPEIKELEIVYRSFELDPQMENYTGSKMADLLAKKYGMPVDVAIQQQNKIAESGKNVGLDYNFDIMKATNTFMAHRLIKYAKAYDKEKAMLDRIYAAFFNEGKLISDVEALAELASEVGLDKEDAKAALLDEEAYALEVREDEAQAKQYGIDVVPFFVLNDRYAFSGAQPVEDMVDTLRKLHEDGLE